MQPVMPPPLTSYRDTPRIARRHPEVAKVYATCLKTGRERIAKMADPGVREPKTHAQYLADYDRTESEKKESPTGMMSETTWRGRYEDANHGYLNTPLPQQGTILSWQNCRVIVGGKAIDPFTNADIYFHQYLEMHERTSGDSPLPRLTLLRRQQGRGPGTDEVLDFLRWERDHADDPVGIFGPHSDTYAALLGTTNGSAAAYLVIQYGDQLGISTITSIEVEAGQNLVFRFA